MGKFKFFIPLRFALAVGMAIMPLESIAQETQLYLLPNFNSTSLADKTLDLIQCAFDKANIYTEVMNQEEKVTPMLYLNEINSEVHASFQRSGQKIDLGIVPAETFGKEFCEKILNLLSAKNPSLFPVNNLGNTVDPPHLSPEKPFLKKYWPYMAIIGVGLGVAAFFILRPSPTSPQTQYKTAGFTLQ